MLDGDQKNQNIGIFKVRNLQKILDLIAEIED